MVISPTGADFICNRLEKFKPKGLSQKQPEVLMKDIWEEIDRSIVDTVQAKLLAG